MQRLHLTLAASVLAISGASAADGEHREGHQRRAENCSAAFRQRVDGHVDVG